MNGGWFNKFPWKLRRSYYPCNGPISKPPDNGETYNSDYYQSEEVGSNKKHHSRQCCKYSGFPITIHVLPPYLS